MAKTKPKTIPTQKDIGSFWQLANVAEQYGVPPTNIVRASRKKLKGKPVIRSRKLSGGKGPVVFYEPDVAAYAKTYTPSRRGTMSKECHLRSLVPTGRLFHWVPVNQTSDGASLCGARGTWSKPAYGKRLKVCERCVSRSPGYELLKKKRN